MSEEEKKLIAGMDELLSEKPAPKTLSEYWSASISQGVIDQYKRGKVVNV